MCGIVAYHGLERSKVDLAAMLARIAHRGPDGEGVHMEDQFGVGHRRLSIIDLAGGGQPLFNEDGTVVLAANNEIYNYRELRAELEKKGHRFVTHSDTEVMIHAYEEWGEGFFDRLRGMFAVVLYDRRKRRCIIGRDHIGIKPLMFAAYRGGHVFASEAKAILALDGFERRLAPAAFQLFMNFRYIPTDDTLFQGIQRLPPGSYATFDDSGRMTLTRYYDVMTAQGQPRVITEVEALEAFSEVFDRAVVRHLESDVPVGTYLSGGIDSSLTTAFASRHSRGINSFCMTFGEPTDEHMDAERVARSVGSSHLTIPVVDTPLSTMPQVIWHVEEPKVNCLQGFALAGEARKRVKVVLSGLGGDELFAGYDNYDYLFPMAMAASLCRVTPFRSAHAAISALQAVAGSPTRDIFFRSADLAVSVFNPVMFYSVLRNSFDHSRTLRRDLLGECKGDPWLASRTLELFYPQERGNIMDGLMRLEMRTKLVNDFLLTEDRVSMGQGLEIRSPFLDRDVMDMALSLPLNLKYRPGNKKYLLKQLAKTLLPRENLAKQKWGFSFNPYLQFKKDLREAAARELTPARIGELGLFNGAWIRKILDHPPSPRLRWHYFNLWVMVGFSIWHRLFIEQIPSTKPPESGS